MYAHTCVHSTQPHSALCVQWRQTKTRQWQQAYSPLSFCLANHRGTTDCCFSLKQKKKCVDSWFFMCCSAAFSTRDEQKKHTHSHTQSAMYVRNVEMCRLVRKYSLMKHIISCFSSKIYCVCVRFCCLFPYGDGSTYFIFFAFFIALLSINRFSFNYCLIHPFWQTIMNQT